MKIRQANDHDQEEWDNYVLSHPQSAPYLLFAWKAAIEAAYGHKCIYTLAEQQNEIKGVFPIVQMRFPGILNEAVSLPFCDVGNCIADTEEVQDLLIKKVTEHAKARKIKKIQIRGELHPTSAIQSDYATVQTGKVRMMLELPENASELFSTFKSKLRSQIRKAEKNGIEFRWGDQGDIDKAYYVFSKNMHELGSPVHSKRFLKAVLNQYQERARLGLAIYENDIVGMGIILLGGRSVSIPWASTLREYNRLAPNMMLYWNFLKYSADHDYAYFDFGRSSAGEGTYKFKKQWGAKPTRLVWYQSSENGSKQIDNDIVKGSGYRDQVASIWKMLPIGLANAIGPCLRKYISL